MHRKQTRKDKDATKARNYRSRYSYVSTNGHEYLAGEDCGIRRMAVFVRDGWKCCKCGSVFNLTLSHSGRTKMQRHWDMDNLEALCWTCHLAKDGNRFPRSVKLAVQGETIEPEVT